MLATNESNTIESIEKALENMVSILETNQTRGQWAASLDNAWWRLQSAMFFVEQDLDKLGHKSPKDRD